MLYCTTTTPLLLHYYSTTTTLLLLLYSTLLYSTLLHSMASHLNNNIEAFLRVFQPDQLDTVNELKEKYKDLSASELTERLYGDFIRKRFIKIKDQRDVSFPEQRSKAWFEARKKVRGTVSGSKPASWFFSMKSEDEYLLQQQYIFHGKKQTFTKEAMSRMMWGVKYEDTACERFIEWSLKKGFDSYVNETGFVRFSSPGMQHLGASPDGLTSITYTGLVVGSKEGEFLMCYVDLCNEFKTCIVQGAEKIAAGKEHKPLNDLWRARLKKFSLPETPDGWSDEGRGTTLSTVVHSILEIKCPQKMYSSIPNYYLCQLHMEMAAYSLREVYFVAWNVKKGTERLRVWKLNFNDGFYTQFMDVVDEFRQRRGANKFGAPWCCFRNTFMNFKMQFSSVKVWEPYLTKLFEPRKNSMEKEFKRGIPKIFLE